MRRAHTGGQAEYGMSGGDSALETENDHLTDALKGKIGMLKELSINIGAEVRDQNQFLGSMDDDFDNAGGFLGKAMGRVKKLAKGSQNYIVLYLVLFSITVFAFLWIIIKF